MSTNYYLLYFSSTETFIKDRSMQSVPYVCSSRYTQEERKKLDLLLPVGKVNKWQQNEKIFEKRR